MQKSLSSSFHTPSSAWPSRQDGKMGVNQQQVMLPTIHSTVDSQQTAGVTSKKFPLHKVPEEIRRNIFLRVILQIFNQRVTVIGRDRLKEDGYQIFWGSRAAMDQAAFCSFLAENPPLLEEFNRLWVSKSVLCFKEGTPSELPDFSQYAGHWLLESVTRVHISTGSVISS